MFHCRHCFTLTTMSMLWVQPSILCPWKSLQKSLHFLYFPCKFSAFWNVFFSWGYNSLWVLTCLIVLFHFYLSTAILLQFWVFIFPKSALTSPPSPHLNLVLLTPVGHHSVILSPVLSLSILTIWPIYLIPCAFIYLTTSACLINRSISSLVLIFHHSEPTRMILCNAKALVY
jgi:hypothetical protein